MLGLTLFFSLALAHATPVLDWVDTPAAAPNIRFLLHEDKEPTASFVAVQRSNDDARMIKLWTELAKDQPPLDELLPHRCFELLRKDLKTHQTWCKSIKGEYFIFVQGGPLAMPAGRLRDVEREALEAGR